MSSADEESIVAEVQAFSEAWSRGDAKAAASFFTEDGVRVGAMGDVQHGRAEVEAAYDKLLHGPFAGAKVTHWRSGRARCRSHQAARRRRSAVTSCR